MFLQKELQRSREAYSCKISACSHVDGQRGCLQQQLQPGLMNVPTPLIHKHTGCLYNAHADPPSFSWAIYKPSSMLGEERGQFMPCPSRPTHGPWGRPGPDFRELLLESRHGRAGEEGRRSDRWGRGGRTDREHSSADDEEEEDDDDDGGGNVKADVVRFMFHHQSRKKTGR